MKEHKTVSSTLCFCDFRKYYTETLCITIVIVLNFAVILLCTLTLISWNDQQKSDKSIKFQKSQEMKRYFEEIVQAINNSPNLKWKAKYNPFGMRSPIFDALFHEHSSKNIVVNKMIDKNFMNDIRKFHESNLMKEHIERLRNFPAQQLPDEFDARKKWPLCSTIHDVPNQGGCGSCFAIAAAGVASDRICIATNATVQVILSADDIISCCAGCGTCIGGDPLKVMIYWVNHGIVTGGPGGCRPYSYNIKCGVPCPLLEFVKNAKRQKCHQKCQKSYYWNDYINDKHYASIAYTMVPRVISLAGYGNIVVPAVTDYFNTKIINNVTKSFPAQETREILKKEIYLSGPITMAFPVAEEFLHYAKGIYSPYPENGFKNRIIYWHVVRIIGWGHDVDGTFYWIAINSYGRNWGEYGLFRIDTRFLEQFGLEYEAALV